ncbi:MAG TPA: TetR/AcrR family transcriptional regulator [Anaerolineales bacterium]|nr:TetR/AcrR family transcriptional regulator [Anaerolineales bacterium]
MTREEILEVAAQIFRQKGFHAASMQEIADAVNLRKASLYHHISSKQEILLDLLDMAMDYLIERTQAIFGQASPPQDRLREAIHRYLQALTDYPDLANVLLIEYRSLEPDLKLRHQPRRDQFEKLWRGLIQEGIDTGLFQLTDASVAAKALLGSMHWVITWYHEDGPRTIQQIATIYSDLLLNGFLIRERSIP